MPRRRFRPHSGLLRPHAGMVGRPRRERIARTADRKRASRCRRLRAMLREAAGRYVALDGRMWRTLIGLFFRPGFLSREYFAGRRRRYIRPARLFLVLSIALFAVLRFTSAPPTFVERDLSQAVRDEIAKENADAG